MAQHNSSGFGRGWIPMERDIGLPGDGQTFYPARPFTSDRRVRFLHLLAVSGNVRRACADVGVSPQSAYVHKRRDAAFSHGWDAALLLARDAAEEMLAERALNGTRETIFYRGEAVGHRVRFDARLLLAHIARLDRHCDQAETAHGIAARFDEFLGELREAGAGGEGPEFRPADDDPGGPEQWYPGNPTREAAVLAARGVVINGFPEDLADLPPEELADLVDEEEAEDASGNGDEDDGDEYPDEDAEDERERDRWCAAYARAQDRAMKAAAAAWDAASTARLSALDALFACAEEPCPALHEEGAPPSGEAPLEFKSLGLCQLRQLARRPAHRPVRRWGIRPHRIKSFAVSAPSAETTMNE